MKRTKMRRQGFIIALALCALTAGLAVLAGGMSKAQAQSPAEPEETVPARRVETSVYGLHTLSRSQTLRLSVVNAGLSAPPEPINPGEVAPPDPIRLRRVTLVFDVYAQEPPDPSRPSAGDGSVRNLRIVRRESRTFMLRPGQAATLEIDAARAGEAVGAWVLGAPPDPIAPGEGEGDPPDPIRSAVVSSLEVRQGNSTLFVLPGTTRGFNPQPDPPIER